MQYIIFDLEWNQPADERAAIQTPVYLTGEIVQIGAVKLDEHFVPVDELRLYITPRYYTKMHKRIAALTGIHDKILAQKGVPFPEAYQIFTQWCGTEYAYMTWSMSDMPMLMDNMILHDIDVSDLPECYDIQRIFSREIMRTDTRYSLDTALNLLKETGDSAHDALHDARNTAKICSHLELEQYLGEYALKIFARKEPHIFSETRQQLLSDPALLTFACPWCQNPVTCEGWLAQDSRTYMAYGSCPDCDEFLAELSVTAHPHKGYFARRILFQMSDDLWDIYMDKKEALGV